MKTKLILFAAVPALALAACGETETDDAADTTVTGEDVSGELDAPTAADTDMVDGGMTDSDDADGTGTSVTASEDGVTVDTNDGDTSVSADIDENPAVEIETN